MTQKTIVHVAPSGHPGGVLEYARCLSDALIQRGSGPSEVASSPLAATGRQASAVLLHYAGYGFQSRGVPFRLVAELSAWRSSAPRETPLVTFFHEVAASGRPWQSSFWLSPLQRLLAARVARMSDHVFTSLELYRAVLSRWIDSSRVNVLPVFSTVGESIDRSGIRNRPRRLVVFGTALVRARSYRQFRSSLETACSRLRIEEVLDLGEGDSGAPNSVASVGVRRMGFLPSAEIRSILSQAFAGFMAYEPAFLPKSTIYAAYCAHGALPVCTWHFDYSNLCYPRWNPNDAVERDDELEEIARAASLWYVNHSLGKQVEVFRRALAGRDSGRCAS